MMDIGIPMGMAEDDHSWRAVYAPRDSDSDEAKSEPEAVRNPSLRHEPEPEAMPSPVEPSRSQNMMRDVADEAVDAGQKKRKQEKQQQAQLQERRRALKQFLKKNGFSDVNSSKRVMLLWTSYPLHTAVEKNNLRVVEMLLAEGADPAATNSSGRTATQIAQRKNKKGSRETMLRVLQAASVGAAAV